MTTTQLPRLCQQFITAVARSPLYDRRSPPTLSNAQVSYNQSLLDDPAWCEQFPRHADLVRRTLDDAKALSGYVPPPKDPRSPTQQRYDASHGFHVHAPSEYAVPKPNPENPSDPAPIAAAFSFASVDPLLGNAILRELAEEPVLDPDSTRATVEKTGRNWQQTVASAAYVLNKTAGKLKPEMLSPRSLIMLAIHGDAMIRHLASRPKKGS